MKKLLFLTLAIMSLIFTGCSSKTVTTSPMGGKTVTTKTDASAYSDAQAQAWQGYYQAIANPPVIATITQPDGSVVAINSQVPPPAPVIRQHENPWVKPVQTLASGVAGAAKTGIITYGVVKALDAVEGINIENTGAGNVNVDKSRAVDVEAVHAEEGSIIKQDSEKDLSDNHVENAAPLVVSPEVVQPEVVVVDPTVVNPEVVIVDPSYPPVESE